MKNWHESLHVFEWLSTLEAERRRAALATIISVHGSVYRREGAKMAVAEDGASVGNVSGGCLESDVREVALQVIASGTPQLRTYRSSVDEIRAWDLGLGCEGEVKIFVEPAYDTASIEQALLTATVPCAVCTVIGTSSSRPPLQRLIVTPLGCEGGEPPPGLTIVAEARAMLAAGLPSAVREISGKTVFVDIYRPPPQLVIIGAGNDARPLARFAVEAGFHTVVVDRRPGLLAPDRFPDSTELVESSAADLTACLNFGTETCAVVMTHNFADDEQYLRALLATSAPYLGVLGPRQRTERLLRHIAADISFDIDRVHGPVGLDLGAEGAEQVALSVVAELLAVRSGRRPVSLRERDVPIHQRALGWQPVAGE
ncbi:MAG TPA: XdhC family protein [Gemmatimonadales bacterium]|jgi:xanthine/CO dehydrogenase XdhC/CoxF family maturation factor